MAGGAGRAHVSGRRALLVLLAVSAVVGAVLVGSSFAGTRTHRGSGSVVVGDWGGGYDQWTQNAFGKPFTNSTGISIKYDDAPGQQVAQVTAQEKANHVTWDMIDSAYGFDAVQLASEGDLQPLPTTLRQHLTKELTKGTVTKYGFYLGTLSDVIACNPSQAKKCPTTPKQFWDVKDYPGPRVMYAYNSLGALMSAELAAGISPKHLFPIRMKLALNMLNKIKPYVKVWYTSGDQAEQAMRSGEAVMGIIWNGRAYDLQKKSIKNLKISWKDAIYEPAYDVVVKGAPDAASAFKFMQWIADNPKAEAAFMKASSYGAPNPKAFKYLPTALARQIPEYPANYRISVPENLQWYHDNQKMVDNAWKKFLG